MQVNQKYILGTLRGIVHLLWIGLFVLFIQEFMPMIMDLDTDKAESLCVVYQWLDNEG